MVDRHPSLFSKEDSAILLVDYQEKFVPVVCDSETVIKNIKFLLAGANIYKVPIIVSEHVPEKLGKTTEEFAEFTKDSTLITKKSMSCCGCDEFLSLLKEKGIKQVAICGIEAHICVQQTALDLIHHGYQVHLVTDGITCRLPYNLEIAIKKIADAGGVISSVETILFEAAYEAGSSEFKELQNLYKTPIAIGK